MFGKNGLFVCVMAGRSTGKSFIIYELAKSETFQKNILVVDTREPKDILSGLVYAPRLNQFYWVPFFTYDIVKGNAQLISEAVDIFVKLPELLKTYGPTFFRRFTYVMKMTAQEHGLPLLIKTVAEANPNVTIVIDEASLAFCTESKSEVSRSTLLILTALTKQRKRVSYH